MSLLPASEAAAHVRGAYDPEVAASLWACQIALLGEPWLESSEGRGEDASLEVGASRRVAMPGARGGRSWPHAPDVWISDGREGASRRLLVNAFSHLAKVRTGLVLPRYPDAPEPIEAARRAYFEHRATADDWDAAFDDAFFHGDALGVGCVRLGVEDRGDHQALVAESVSPLRVLWSPTEANPTRSPWVAFSLILPYYQAVEMYGETRAEAAAEGEAANRTVRVVEYWDRGLGPHAPTHCTWLGDVSDELPARHEANAFGIVPAAFYVHLLAPGMRRPMGRVSMQLATAARIALLEEMIRRVAEMPPATAIDRSLFEASVAEEMSKTGLPDRFLFDSSSLGDARGRVVSPIFRIPAGELNPLLYQELQALKAQLDAESGVNDYDRGAVAQGQRTATEIEFLNQRTGAVAAWPVKQLGKFYQSVYAVAGIIGAGFDDEPMVLPVASVDVPYNVPGVREGTIEALFADKSRVTIEEESLYAGGTARKRAEQTSRLTALLPFAGAGGPIDQRKLVERILAAQGLDTDLLAPVAPAPIAPGRPPGLVPPGVMAPGGAVPGGAGLGGAAF